MVVGLQRTMQGANRLYDIQQGMGSRGRGRAVTLWLVVAPPAI